GGVVLLRVLEQTHAVAAHEARPRRACVCLLDEAARRRARGTTFGTVQLCRHAAPILARAPSDFYVREPTNLLRGTGGRRNNGLAATPARRMWGRAGVAARRRVTTS